jgi:hypothetical protein
MTVLKELSKYLVEVQEIRWDADGTEPAGEYTFLYRKEIKNHDLGTVF